MSNLQQIILNSWRINHICCCWCSPNLRPACPGFAQRAGKKVHSLPRCNTSVFFSLGGMDNSHVDFRPKISCFPKSHGDYPWITHMICLAMDYPYDLFSSCSGHYDWTCWLWIHYDWTCWLWISPPLKNWRRLTTSSPMATSMTGRGLESMGWVMLDAGCFFFCWIMAHDKANWLVVGSPLWKIWKSIGMIRNPILMGN